MKIVTTHKGADFDALASVVAATLLYPGSIAVMPKNQNPNVKSFLSIHKDLFETYSPGEIDIDEVDTLIVVDTNSWDRLENLSGLKNKKDLEIILWDHHVKGDLLPNWECREETGATISLLSRELQKRDIELTPIQATLFLIGLYEDTGNMTFPSTKPEDALAASYLLSKSADLNILSTFLRQVYGEKQKDVLFRMLQGAERMRVKGHKISICKLDITGHVGNLSVVVSMYREIINVEAAFGIFMDKERDRCFVIGRSHTDDLNIGSIMRSIGGGGHPGAGSAMLKSVNPEVIEEMVISIIEGNHRTSIPVTDLMSYPVHSVPPEMTMRELSLELREKGCTGFPVVDNGRMVGVVSIRDFRRVKKDYQMDSPIKAFMSSKIITIEPERSPIEAARIMIKHDIGRLPIMKDGEIIGIISRSDAMTYFYDLMPE
jgi:nanoRNase/pAp phosphatase (c-di-AMP/oligoRNAs hydrolase)